MTKINDFLIERETEGLANFHFTPTAKKPSSDGGEPPPPTEPPDDGGGDDGEGEYNPEPDAHPHALHTADPADLTMLWKHHMAGKRKYATHGGFTSREQALEMHTGEWGSGFAHDRAVITADHPYTERDSTKENLWPHEGDYSHGPVTIEHVESYPDKEGVHPKTGEPRIVHHFHATRFNVGKHEVKESVGKTVKELLFEAPWDTGYELTPHEKMEEYNNLPFDQRLNQFAHHVYANRNISKGIDRPGYHPIDPETGESLLGHEFASFKKKNGILKGQLDRPEFATRGYSTAHTESMNAFKHVPVGTTLSHAEFMDLAGNNGFRLHRETPEGRNHWAHSEILNSLDPHVTYHGARPNYTGMHNIVLHMPEGTVGARMVYGMNPDDTISNGINDTGFKFHPGVRFEKIQDHREEGREIKDRKLDLSHINQRSSGYRRRRAKIPVTTQHFMVRGLENNENN